MVIDLEDITHFIKERTFVLNIKLDILALCKDIIFVKGTKEECKILVYVYDWRMPQ